MGNARAREERARLRPINLITSVNYRKREHKLNCKLAMRNHREEHSTHSRAMRLAVLRRVYRELDFLPARERRRKRERGGGLLKQENGREKGGIFNVAPASITRERAIS